MRHIWSLPSSLYLSFLLLSLSLYLFNPFCLDIIKSQALKRKLHSERRKILGRLGRTPTAFCLLGPMSRDGATSSSIPPPQPPRLLSNTTIFLFLPLTNASRDPVAKKCASVAALSPPPPPTSPFPIPTVSRGGWGREREGGVCAVAPGLSISQPSLHWEFALFCMGGHCKSLTQNISVCNTAKRV